MLALHCLGSATGEVAYWAEDSERPARRAGRAPRAAGPHPFAADGPELAKLVCAGRAEVRPVLLPSHPSAPAGSPELVRDPLTAGPAPRGRVRLAPWLTPVAVAPAASVRAVLDQAADTSARPGASVRFLVRVAELADDLVGRGRVLPVVEPGPSARWRPTLSGVDSARFARLRDAMPPAFRAAQHEDDLLDGLPAETLLHATLGALVDSAVRERLRGTRILPQWRNPSQGPDAATEAFLLALTGEPGFDADPEPVDRLADRLDRWRAGAARESPVRACFRLRSPEQAQDVTADDWTLDFLLQAADDPSVLVPAAQVWRGEGDSVLRRWVPQPQELLLAELGRAGRIVPALDAALGEAHPVGLRTDADGAHEFLTRAAELDQAGFGVLLPSWWRRSGDVSLRLTAASTGTAGTIRKDSALGLAELVDYRWDLALGDLRLTEGELAELAAAKASLVRLRGQWVHVDRKRLAAGLAFLESSGAGRMPAGEVLHLAGLHPGEQPQPLPVAEVAGTGWLGELLAGTAETGLEPVHPPAEFTAELRPYQRRGLAWLAFLDRLGLGACLADDMGLGKTVQLLALEVLTRAPERRPPTLLVCPMSMVGTWQREAERFAPSLAVHVHHGADRLGGPALAATGADLVVTTYTTATRDAELLGGLSWDRIVLDEAQNIKNSASRQSRTLRALPARHRVALTGTPVENRLAELWTIMDFANPGLLGSLASFRARYAVPVERYGDTDAAARLRRVTGPFVLRRVKTDPTVISDLPDKIEMKQLCTLTPEQATLYRAVVDDMLDRIADSEGLQRKGLVLATMSKLKQVCNHPAQFLGDGSRVAGRSGKLARLEEILDEVLADGDRALCFTQFARFGGMLVPHLAARFDTEVAFLHGGTPKRAREVMVERFQSGEGPPILLLSLKAGGTGLTLTGANHVVHLDRWWNPAVEDQATDRAFRIGQERTVQVRKFVCIGTLEEKIDTMIEEKKALAKLVVGAGEDWLTELSTGQLRELVALTPEAVGE